RGVGAVRHEVVGHVRRMPAEAFAQRDRARGLFERSVRAGPDAESHHQLLFVTVRVMSGSGAEATRSVSRSAPSGGLVRSSTLSGSMSARIFFSTSPASSGV